MKHLQEFFLQLFQVQEKYIRKEYGDGITAFLLTGLFSYLAYTNFENDHPTRAWIFTALGAGFYAGNIYGSVCICTNI